MVTFDGSTDTTNEDPAVTNKVLQLNPTNSANVASVTYPTIATVVAERARDAHIQRRNDSGGRQLGHTGV